MVTKTVELASQLIAVPSYVSSTCNERAVVEFIAAYVRQYLPQLGVRLALAQGQEGRPNLYLLGDKRPSVVFVGHVDTVRPSGGWNGDPLLPTIKNERLYGLGAADMKGSIAALLVALQNVEVALLDEVAVLLYVDEEYQFAGMKQLIQDKVVPEEDQPDLIVSLDGGLEVLSGCRGLIKIDMEVLGKSGHTSNPNNGINAITKIMEVMGALEAKLPQYSSNLGASTMSVARLNGGATLDVDRSTDMQRAGNVIPNYAECILELRTASPELSAATVEQIIRKECSARQLKVKSLKSSIDLGSWQGSLKSPMTRFIKQCYARAGASYKEADPRWIGFIDVQMLAEKVDSPIYVIGTGGENRHGADENVELESLEKVREIYQTIISTLGEYNGKN